MHTRTSNSLSTQHVGGGLAVALFVFTLIAFVVESQLTQVSPARNCHHLVRYIYLIASIVCSDDARLSTAILYLVSFVRPLNKISTETARSYLVHSAFAIIFPLHILYLLVTTDYTAAALLKGLSIAITNHLSPGHKSTGSKLPRAKFLRLVLGLTIGITYPALLWFSAVSLAS